MKIVFFVLLGFLLLLGSFTFFFESLFTSRQIVYAQSAVPIPATSSCTFTRAGQAAPYQSTLLLSYFQEVAQKTGVPAAVIAAIARVESTTGTYSISNYTDDEIHQMEDTSKILQDIDATIPGTQKALCPRSPTGALGLMQIQPSSKILNTMKLKNEDERKAFNAGAHSETSVNNGAKFIGKDDSSLTIQDYCNPKTNMYIAAGFILNKIKGLGYGDGTKWNPAWDKDKKVFETIAESYYGCLNYGGPNPNKCEGPQSYGDDIWKSYQDCSQIFSSPINPGASSSLSTTSSGGAESNEVITRVGNVCAPIASASGKIVVLNPGHAFGLTDPVAVGGTDASGTDIETPKNVALAEMIEKDLITKGYKVYVLHRGEGFDKNNRYNDYQQRIDKSNSFNPDLYVEIHFQTDNAGPFSIYSDRRVTSTDGKTTTPNTNVVTPDVDGWLTKSRKAATAITKALADQLNRRYGTNYDGAKEVSDYGCVGRACGGHIYTIGPQGTLANPDEGEKSKILRENKAVSAYIETLGLANKEQGNDLALLANAYVQGIESYFGTNTQNVDCLPGSGGDHPKAPPIQGDARQAIIDKFGITMNGFNQDNLQWAWEKFWDVSNTKFIDLARGTVVVQTNGIPEQINCKTLLINNSATQKRLNVILLHEIGHIIDHCNPDSVIKHTEHENIFKKEGGITGYGSNACFGTPAQNEDYAEMITYYLNPGVTEMIECHNRGQVPFADGKYPLHYQLAKSILGPY